MAVILALGKLFDDVAAKFTADGDVALVSASTFGWREPPRYGGTTRIEWVPGDDASGSAGEIAPPKYPGRIPHRPVGTLQELFTVYLTAHDATAPANERAQWQATRQLFDKWYRAVYLVAYGTFEIASVRWLHERKEGRFGATLRVLGSIQSMIPDVDPAASDTIADHANVTSSIDDTADPVQVIDREGL